MGQISLVEALALLLSNPHLREEFAISASGVADKININGSEREHFCALSVIQLNEQAGLLIKKRRREAHAFLPLTFQMLGPDGVEIFNQYAVEFWPTSCRRHQEDAWRFCQYLLERDHSYNRSEWNRVSFKQKKSKWNVRLVSDVLIKRRRTVAIQFLFRLKHVVREKHLYLGF